MQTSPIALFVFNRPDHTRRTLQALAQNQGASDHDLFVFADGARRDSDLLLTEQVREVCRNFKGFRSLHMIESQGNKGLASSIIGGVEKILSDFETVTVVEDDLVTSPYFLPYINQGLQKYEHEDQVISIHGYNYPETTQPTSFFVRGADCWGWATWRRGWSLFEKDGTKLLQEIRAKQLCREFDFNHSYRYTKMLEDQIHGRNNSWAIRWYASAFLANRLTLYPAKSLVQNIGFDGSGSHSSETLAYEGALEGHGVPPWPTRIEESPGARSSFERAFASHLGIKGRLRYQLLKSLGSRRKPANSF